MQKYILTDVKKEMVLEMNKENLLCPCCKKHYFQELDFYEVCPVCNWQDDPVQRDDPDFDGGANDMSLNQAREAWKNGKQIR